MKKIWVFLLCIVAVMSFSSINFNGGLSVLTDENPFRVAVKTGFESENFNFSFELAPDTTNLNLANMVTITDISAKIYDFNKDLSIDIGLLWLNHFPTKDSLANNEKVSLPYLYTGFKYQFLDILYGKLSFGYPISSNFEPSLNIADYLILNIGIVLPKPKNFIDDIKFEFRFNNYRRDFSMYLSVPIQ